MSEAIVKLLGDKVITKGGTDVATSEFKDKMVGFYFSAHWCPPCKAFTPVLAGVYETLVKAGKAFEIVFVSSDQDADSFEEYFGVMPWKAVKFDEEDRRQALGEEYGIRGIPALIIVNAEGKLITKDGRADVSKLKDKAYDAWAAATPK